MSCLHHDDLQLFTHANHCKISTNVLDQHVPEAHVQEVHVPEVHVPDPHVPEVHVPEAHVPDPHVPAPAFCILLLWLSAPLMALRYVMYFLFYG